MLRYQVSIRVLLAQHRLHEGQYKSRKYSETCLKGTLSCYKCSLTFCVFCRKFDQLSAIMHDDNNWSAYNQEIDQKLKANTPFIPFLGVFLTATAFFQAASSKLESRHSSVSYMSGKFTPERRRSSETNMYETYHLLEAITVRERLNKLRENTFAHDGGMYKKGLEFLQLEASSNLQPCMIKAE